MAVWSIGREDLPPRRLRVLIHSGTPYPLCETFTPIGSTSPFPCAFASQSSLPSPIRNPLPTGGMKRAGIREQHLREQVRCRTIMRPPSSVRVASQRGRHPDMNIETSRGRARHQDIAFQIQNQTLTFRAFGGKGVEGGILRADDISVVLEIGSV